MGSRTRCGDGFPGFSIATPYLSAPGSSLTPERPMPATARPNMVNKWLCRRAFPAGRPSRPAHEHDLAPHGGALPHRVGALRHDRRAARSGIWRSAAGSLPDRATSPIAGPAFLRLPSGADVRALDRQLIVNDPGTQRGVAWRRRARQVISPARGRRDRAPPARGHGPAASPASRRGRQARCRRPGRDGRPAQAAPPRARPRSRPT